MTAISKLIPTVDPFVFIEEQRPGFVVYRQLDDQGVVVRRWSVSGYCDKRGYCLLGAVIDGKEVTHEDIIEGRMKNKRLQSEMDVPITPEFKDCCPFEYEELQCL